MSSETDGGSATPGGAEIGKESESQAHITPLEEAEVGTPLAAADHADTVPSETSQTSHETLPAPTSSIPVEETCMPSRHTRKTPSALLVTANQKRGTTRAQRAHARDTSPERENISVPLTASDVNDACDANDTRAEGGTVPHESSRCSETEESSAPIAGNRRGVKRNRSAPQSAVSRKKAKTQHSPPSASAPLPQPGATPATPADDAPLPTSVHQPEVDSASSASLLATVVPESPSAQPDRGDSTPSLLMASSVELTEPPSSEAQDHSEVPCEVGTPSGTTTGLTPTPMSAGGPSPVAALPVQPRKRAGASSTCAPASPSPDSPSSSAANAATPVALPFEALRRTVSNIAGVNIAALLADSSHPPPTFSRRMTARRAKRRPTLFADHPQFVQHRALRSVARARRGPHSAQTGGSSGGGGLSAHMTHGMVVGSHGHLYPPFFMSPFSTDEDVLHTLNEWTDSVPLVYASLLWKYTPQAFLASAMQHSPCITKLEAADGERCHSATSERSAGASCVPAVKREQAWED